VTIALLLTVATGCSSGGQKGATKLGPSTVPFIGVDEASASPTDRQIARLQRRLRTQPADPGSRLGLAQAFLQKAREVGDPTLYDKANGLVEQLADARPNDPAVLVTQGSVALAQHRFEDALERGHKARKVAPEDTGAMAVVVDAANELGRYEEALSVTEEMVDLKPNLASLSRVSYARELRGDVDGAVAAMTQAATAGRGSDENVAYVQVLLGNLLLNRGDLAAAEASFAAADRSFPGFVLAKAARARLLVARGDTAGAAGVLAEVVPILPAPENAVAHGDALQASGRDREAADAYALVDVIARLYQANGVNLDLELALFEADHRPTRKTVQRARQVAEDRPTVQAHDALAWSLYRTGKANDAWEESERALALGSRDPLLRFHAAAIAFDRGDRPAAISNLQMVLDTNPRFSALHAARVSELAGSLGLSVPGSSPP
jgi:tetratricopeptide (TPR) repeat protein